MDRPDRIVLEVCVESLAGAKSAVDGGADRLELNSGLAVGGLTPSIGLVQLVRAESSVPLIAMLRPRAAGFVYDAFEKQTMLRDAEQLLAAGVDGVAAGCLTASGDVDGEFWAQLTSLVKPREVVFHRAIDVVASPEEALRALAQLGTTRVLTSGGAPSCLQGAARIADWQRQFGNQLEILPGSGIRPDNILRVLQETTCQQLHGSFSTPASDEAGPVCEPVYSVTSTSLVAEARAALDLYSDSQTGGLNRSS